MFKSESFASQHCTGSSLRSTTLMPKLVHPKTRRLLATLGFSFAAFSASTSFAQAPLLLQPALSFASLPVASTVGAGGQFFSVISNSNGTISVSVTDPRVCTVSVIPPLFTSASQCIQPGSCPTRYALSPRALGICTVVALQAAEGNYAAGALRQDLIVTKGAQAIDDFFEFIKLASVGRTPVELDSNKLNAVSFGYSPATFSTPSLPSICTVQGSLLTIVGAGACVINANRVENALFAAAQRTGTLPIYAVPAPFSFATQVNTPINTAVISNEATINGIAAETPISITSRYSFDVEGDGYGVSFNAEYSIGCTSAYISTPSVISNGQKVCIRVVTGSSTLGNSTIATLLIGATTAEFKVNASDTGSLVNRYRLFVPSTGGHFFTTNKAEYDYLIKLSGTYVDEGVDHKIYVKPRVQNTSAQAYYRVYIKSVRQHFWTADLGEYQALIKQTDVIVDEGFDGWIFPTAGFPNSVPLYRLVLNNTAIHHWTTDKNEFDFLVRSGSWTPEGRPENPSGVTGYVMPK